MTLRRRAGFTLIEMVFVILIGSILVGVALSSFQNAQAAIATRSAKNMYATAHQRARARAIELGQRVVFFVDTVGDSTYVFADPDGAGPLPSAFGDVTHFRSELNVDLRATPATFLICMTPRGYADPACPLPPITTPTRVEFWLNADSSSVTILPMGQLIGL